jgi:hypothetical protein
MYNEEERMALDAVVVSIYPGNHLEGKSNIISNRNQDVEWANFG